jgi:hypothetical protein
MDQQQREPDRPGADEALSAMARRYLWWEHGRADAVPRRRVIAQLMNVGDYDDVLRMLDLLGEVPFRDALAHAQAGWFNPRSWSYWHLRLGLRKPGERTPPLPLRRIE